MNNGKVDYLEKARFFSRIWKRRLLIFLAVIGPGIITAVADNDAGGVATYTVAAAMFGVASQLLIIPTTLLLGITQDIGARIAVIARKGLGDLIREHYGIKVSMLIFLIYYIVNQGVVLQNISGLKASYQLFNLPWKFLLILTCFFLILFVVNFNYKKIQKIFLLLTFFYASYVIVAVLIRPDWPSVIKETFLPQKIKPNLGYWFTLIAVLGTTVTAWGQFFVASYVNDKKLSVDQLKYEKVEIYLGAFITNFFSFMIAVSVAGTLFASHIVVNDAQTAALALKPLAGDLTFILFASGLFGASLLGLTIIPLATAYVFSELFGYEGSLDTDFKRGKLFYAFFSIQILIALVIALFPQVNLFQLTLYVDFLNGAMLPVIFYFLIKFAENKEIMGYHVLNKFEKIFLRAAAVVITLAVIIASAGKILHIT